MQRTPVNPAEQIWVNHGGIHGDHFFRLLLCHHNIDSSIQDGPTVTNTPGVWNSEHCEDSQKD